jgi:hypothetical protein
VWIYHAIIDPNDRYFNSSIGNWDTNGVWDPNTYGAYSKVTLFKFQDILTDGFMQLNYPSLKIKPGKWYTFFFDSIRVSSSQQITIEWILSDGIYTISGSKLCGVNGYHDRITERIRIPNNWNNQNFFLRIILYYTGILPLQWAIDNVTLYFTWYTQHLPVSGAG